MISNIINLATEVDGKPTRGLGRIYEIGSTKVGLLTFCSLHIVSSEIIIKQTLFISTELTDLTAKIPRDYRA